VEQDVGFGTVASSNGNKPTDASVNGHPVIVGVNAYIKPGIPAGEH
jgi:hypothetical protein